MKNSILSTFYPLLRSIYGSGNGLFRVIIERIVRKFEGDVFWSETLRKLYLEVHGIDVGIGSYGCFVPAQFPRGTKVGNYCSIGPNVRYLNANHPVDFASMHPIFYAPSFTYVKKEKIPRSRLTIGNDVWIGHGVMILSKCTSIGDGAVIAAGSIVTQDIEPYAIVAGVPARVIRYRFGPETCKKLMNSKWFELSPEILGSFAEQAEDVELFLQSVYSYRNNTQFHLQKAIEWR